MKTFQLNAEPRTDLGKKATKALRLENKIPAVINGGKLVTLNEKGEYEGTLAPGEKVVKISNQGKAIITTDIVVNFNDVRKLIYTPDVFVIDLTVNGQTRKAVLKDTQFHAVDDSILHIDLLEVTEDKPIIMNVPVKVTGHAVGVKAGGKLYLNLKKVKVKGLYDNIPERVVVNVDNVNIGQTVKVGSLQFDNYELASAKDLVIAGVRATRAAAAAAAAATTTDEAAAE